MNGRGAGVGPDLSAAGTNSASYLHSVILDPNSPALRMRRWFGPRVVSVKTRDGQQLHGIARAEDSFNLILVDETGKMHRIDLIEQPDRLDRDELFAVRAGLRLLQCNPDTPLSIQELATIILIFLDRDNMNSKRVHRGLSR